MAEQRLIQCPYDVSHRVKESRFQIHIAKCKLNNLDRLKKNCPFNATHLVDEVEYNHHIMNCPDRAPLDRHIAQSVDKNNPYRGRNAVPQFSDPHVEEEENWDAELTRVNVRTAPPPGAIIEPRAMAKPAERKKLYKDLHQLSSESPDNSRSPKVTEVLRQPKQPCQGEQSGAMAQPLNTKVIENLSYGRGRNSRIAANIFVNAENGASANATYSNVVRDMSNLCLFRGMPTHQAEAPVFEKDDFPALGCGRGGIRAPKQNLRSPGVKSEK